MTVKDAENLKSGLRKTGIYPLDRKQVLAGLQDRRMAQLKQSVSLSLRAFGSDAG